MQLARNKATDYINVVTNATLAGAATLVVTGNASLAITDIDVSAKLGLRGARMVHVGLEPLLAEAETVSADDQEAVPPAEGGDSGAAFADDDLNDL